MMPCERLPGDYIVHRPWFKTLLNPFLRRWFKLQIATVCAMEGEDLPRPIRYCLMRVPECPPITSTSVDYRKLPKDEQIAWLEAHCRELSQRLEHGKR